MHQCVSCELCSLYIVIYVLIAASDSHAYAFAISVAILLANMYTRDQYRYTKKSINRLGLTIRHCCSTLLITRTYNDFTKHDIHKLP